MNKIFERQRLGGKFAEYIADTRRGNCSAVFGLPFSARSYALSKMDSFVFYIVADHLSVEKAKEDLSLFLGGEVDILTAKEEVLLYKKAVSHDTCFTEMSALYRMLRGISVGVVLTIETLTRLFPSRARFEKAIVSILHEEELDPYGLVKKLISMGYRREEQVTERGQFSLRGDILDVFSVQWVSPVRIEFFGDTVESIREFDPGTQKSDYDLERIEICPATDVLIEDSEISEVEKGLDRDYRSMNLPENYRIRLKSIIDDVMVSLKDGNRDTTLSFIYPYTQCMGKLSEYLPQNSIVALDEPKRLLDRLSLLYQEHDTRYENLLSCGELLKGHYFQLKNRQTLFEEFKSFKCTAFHMLATNTNIFEPEVVYTIKSTPTSKYNNNIPELVKDLQNWLYNEYKILIQAKDTDTAKNLVTELGKLEMPYCTYAETDLPSHFRGIAVMPYELSGGFILHDCKLVVLGTSDVIRSRKQGLVHRKNTEVFLAPEVGDYVVHETHGIGICRGITRLSVQFEKEYLSIEFRDGDMLYVPCDQLDVLAKYSGGETAPRLNKIGGKEFAVLKEKVKKYVREMAINLRELYAARSSAVGFAFSKDGELQREFEEAFEFTETDDQLRCVEEIKRDMESNRVMERLLCGDVGYGKTEVALRAAFKAVADGKQVAILSPTTILSDQHYNLCVKRFADFGIRIGSLNRFSSAKEQEETVDKLKQGKLDIVSGTHRLLSKDVGFFDLGLLIVDEEQRFGVEDKEKIKLVKKNVDVLTLTATPIPRTLHMSMTGIRDISVIETPPKERLPIQTYVAEFTDSLLCDAVRRELGRSGQVFILYNKVESINSFAYKVSKIIPEAEIVVAHGQMKEGELEKAILSFYNGQKNVLICTTIIENGIDIPNANTLIVMDSDHLGLSQLYQLRGRVGRSNRLAHVYFTYQQDKVLTENAYKRLNSILEFTEFGSGFKIAMRDLEIRGAGSVLGREQHGHMEKVGYDMYIKLLRQAVDELSGKLVMSSKVMVDADVDAFIPDDYITDNSARIRVYQSIANISEPEDAEEILNDLRDIYGVVPIKVYNLIRIALCRIYAREIGAESVLVKNMEAGITFGDLAVMNNDRLLVAVAEHTQECLMSFSDKPMLIFRVKGLTNQEVFEKIYNFLRNL